MESITSSGADSAATPPPLQHMLHQTKLAFCFTNKALSFSSFATCHAAALCCVVLCADLRGQNAQAARLGQVLAEGPLGDVATGLTNVLQPITDRFEVGKKGCAYDLLQLQVVLRSKALQSVTVTVHHCTSSHTPLTYKHWPPLAISCSLQCTRLAHKHINMCKQCVKGSPSPQLPGTESLSRLVAHNMSVSALV